MHTAERAMPHRCSSPTRKRSRTSHNTSLVSAQPRPSGRRPGPSMRRCGPLDMVATSGTGSVAEAGLEDGGERKVKNGRWSRNASGTTLESTPLGSSVEDSREELAPATNVNEKDSRKSAPLAELQTHNTRGSPPAMNIQGSPGVRGMYTPALKKAVDGRSSGSAIRMTPSGRNGNPRRTELKDTARMAPAPFAAKGSLAASTSSTGALPLPKRGCSSHLLQNAP